MTAAAHAPGIPGQFLWDDEYWIRDNPILNAGAAPWGYWWTTKTVDYLPVTSTTFYLERQLWGDRASDDPKLPYPALPYRAFNVACQALAAILLWRVLVVLEAPGAWLAAMLFAVHPVTVASVGWVAELKNTLSLIFYALAILAYLRFDARGQWRYYALAAAAFALALLSKASVVVLPAVLVTILWWKRRPLWKPRQVISLLGLGLLAAAGSAIMIWFHQASRVSSNTDIGAPHGIAQHLLTAAKALWFYAYKAVLPVHLNLIYPKWNAAKLDWTALAIPALLAWIGALVVLRRRAWRARPRRRQRALFCPLCRSWAFWICRSCASHTSRTTWRMWPCL